MVGREVIEGLHIDGALFFPGPLCCSLVTCTQGWAWGDEGSVWQADVDGEGHHEKIDSDCGLEGGEER